LDKIFQFFAIEVIRPADLEIEDIMKYEKITDDNMNEALKELES
jgi:hypothetical protein